MSQFQAKFTALEALFTADTGSGGFKNTSSAAFCHDMVQADDPYPRHAPPYIIVQDAGSSQDGPLAGAKMLYPGVVNLHVFTDRGTDQTSAGQSAIVKRIQTVYSNVTPTTVGEWKFGPIRVVREFSAPATEKTRHRVVQLLFGATGGN